MPKPEEIPEPWKTRIDALWNELADADFFNRYDGEIKKNSQELAGIAAFEILKGVGRQRLTSEAFWNHYDDATNGGMDVLADPALCNPIDARNLG